MESHERDFFIARINSGFLKYKGKDDLVLHILPPSHSVVYDAQEVYNDVYRKASLEGLPDTDDVVVLLSERGLWTIKMETDFQKIPDNIEKLKVELYGAIFRSNARQKLREYLTITKQEYIRLAEIRGLWDHMTCEGVASFSRWQHTIEQCVVTPDGKPYDWSEVSVAEIMHYFNEQSLTESQLRELSRTDPWLSMWSVSKKTGISFPHPLTVEQRALIMWSTMYDSINESSECPHQSVIDDDDMLDGWLIVQRKERDKNQNKKRGEELTSNSRISNSQEVFIQADTAEDAASIADMNEARGKVIRSSRLKQVERDGKVDFKDFADVKQKKNMDSTKQFTDTVKGR